MGVEKDTVSLGSTHKQPKCLTRDWPSQWPQIGQKLLLHKEKRQKDKWFHFHAATVLGFPKAKKCWRCEVAEAHKCWTFDIFEVHEAQNAGFLGRGRFSKHKNAGNSGAS